VPENAFFYFFGVLFFGQKDIRIFVFFFFGTKIAVKKNKKKESQYFG